MDLVVCSMLYRKALDEEEQRAVDHGYGHAIS
jgi:hypothetical protein